MNPRDLSRRTRRHIAQGYLDPNKPLSLEGLTRKGEEEAERRHERERGLEDGYDVGDFGWDPGDDRPA